MEIPLAVDPTVDEEEELEPEVTTAPPKHIRSTRRINGDLYVAGEGPREGVRVMFIAIAAAEEETMETQIGIYGAKIRQRARYLKGPAGAIFKDILGFVGMDINKCYYTALCKSLLPKNNRLKPTREQIAWHQEALFNEIKEIKPEVIVCLGRPVFDLLNELKLKIPIADIKCCWFRSERFNCRLFPMDDVGKPYVKPEFVDKFKTDLTEVKKMLDRIDGTSPPEVVRHYRTIENSSQLGELLEMFDREKITHHSVDCEWRGNNHVSGKLRSMQDCWAPGHAAYLKFMDQKGDYVFDIPYDEAGAMMQRHYNKPEIRYYGHHIAADFPWMASWLGLEWFNRCVFDSEFGQQCIDEFEDLGLERMAIKYTDLGRYDLELMLWLKMNKQDKDAGYAYVPDSVIIPYGCSDVDTVFRTQPQIMAELKRQGLTNYYNNLFLPFVTNMFTNFAMVGMPMNIPQMDELRDLFSFAKEEMGIKLQKSITLEAESLLFRKLASIDKTQGVLIYAKINKLIKAGKHADAFAVLKQFAGVAHLAKLEPFYEHRIAAPSFNIRSGDQMRRWLFEVKGLTPIKSTNNKEKGLPATPWHKVMELPADRQKEFKPAADKQTLQILGEGDPLIGELLRLNAVGNLSKAFLKEPEVDEETGEVTRENGLHYWLCHDKRIHGQMSTTETGRPRAWKPNSLNWPSFVNKAISSGIEKTFKVLHEEGKLPERWHKYMHPDTVPSIRSCVDCSAIAPLEGSIGWCLVESDYQTAEVRGLAYISGDPAMIRFFEEPDAQFCVLVGQDPTDADAEYVRLNYAADCGIKAECQDQRVIMKKVSKREVKDILAGHPVPEGKTNKEYAFELIDARAQQGLAIPFDYQYYFHLEPVQESDLLRTADGSYAAPRYDFHWSLAEMVNHKPRELMGKKVERAAAKVGNFCIAEGELVLTKRGPIPIENVLCCDLLWDGTQWVSHEGVIDKGTGTVHFYQGLWATDNHTVWLADGTYTLFGMARAQRLELARTAGASGEAIRAGFADLSRDDQEIGTRLLLRDDVVRQLWGTAGEGAAQHGERAVLEMPVPKPLALQRFESAFAGCQVRGDAAAVRAGHPRVVAQLQGQGDQGPVQIPEGLRDVGAFQVAYDRFLSYGLRSEEQQRALLEAQSPAGDAHGEPDQSAGHTGGAYRACQSVYGSAPGSDLHRADVSRVSAQRVEREEAAGASSHQSQGCGTKEARIYDILNAGPLHRFTCSGVLVSNSSAYGATGETLERKIEADTGAKPPEGTGQALLDAIGRRQPIATAFLEAVAEIPRHPGKMRAASGRIRHFYLHPDNFYGISQRQQRGMAAGMGREARNFPMQESVASTASRAGNWLLEYGRKHGLHGRPMVILYDSVVTLCPIEEREIWVKAHKLFMDLKNGWWYHGRVLTYPIDTEINPGWSLPAPKKSQLRKDLYDLKNYGPLKPEHRRLVDGLQGQIDYYTANPRAGVYNVADMKAELQAA